MDENQTMDHDRIMKINIEEEMKSSYIDYSMSVIVARALPDVRDGFKPVHRRILYGMLGIGNTSDKPYKKCARVVGGHAHRCSFTRHIQYDGTPHIDHRIDDIRIVRRHICFGYRENDK